MVYVTTNGFRPLQKCLGFSGLHILYDLNKAGTSEGSCSEIPAYVTALFISQTYKLTASPFGNSSMIYVHSTFPSDAENKEWQDIHRRLGGLILT